MNKHQEVLSLLIKSIRNRDGEDRVQEIQVLIKKRVFASLERETICQIMALEKTRRRLLFFLLCPGLIVPYLFRIREE